MGDYLCRDCQDQGDCMACSSDLQPERVHPSCGFKWKDHIPDKPYPYWYRCPKKGNAIYDARRTILEGNGA